MADQEIIREWIVKAEDDFHGLRLTAMRTPTKLIVLPIGLVALKHTTY